MNPADVYLKSARLSPDETCRFTLKREWLSAANLRVRGSCLWVGHNPSTADAEINDPTVRRMMDFSDRWGHGRMALANLLPVRTSSPYLAHKWFFEPWSKDDWDVSTHGRAWAICENAKSIIDLSLDADRVVLCWGAIAGPISNLARDVRQFFRDRGIPVYVLGLTQDGSPMHPLSRGRNRVPDDVTLTEWCLETSDNQIPPRQDHAEPIRQA